MKTIDEELLPCFICTGTLKCPYCKGKGERTSKILKRTKMCKKCKGTGACPNCLGEKKLWADKKLKEWIPDDLRDEYIELGHKRMELRRRYEYLRNKHINVKSIEEFMKERKYVAQWDKARHRNISGIFEVTLDLEQKLQQDYEKYLNTIKQ